MIRDVAIHHLNLAVMTETGWSPFTDSIDLLGDPCPAVPAGGGVYVLMSNATHFTYPAGACSVFYIGMASNLQKRVSGADVVGPLRGVAVKVQHDRHNHGRTSTPLPVV